ncbi:hypothetical protein MP638_005178, partial [Amoeboaphelidium occidentale]
MSKHQRFIANYNLQNQPVFLGSSEFDEVIKENALVIDKTMFIKEFMLDGSKSFLSYGAKPSDFERYLIGKDQKFVEDNCGKYPVVFLNLKDCKGRTWEE